MRYKLKDNHPDKIRIDEACNFLLEKGITFGRGTVTVDNNVYRILDLESDWPPINCFPPSFDYRVILDTDFSG